MSDVNLGDFDATLLANKQAALHRVYRYGADGKVPRGSRRLIPKFASSANKCCRWVTKEWF